MHLGSEKLRAHLSAQETISMTVEDQHTERRVLSGLGVLFVRYLAGWNFKIRTGDLQVRL